MKLIYVYSFQLISLMSITEYSLRSLLLLQQLWSHVEKATVMRVPENSRFEIDVHN